MGRVVAGRKAKETVCIVMVFSQKGPRRNGECFESFCGNVQSGALELTARTLREPRAKGDAGKTIGRGEIVRYASV